MHLACTSNPKIESEDKLEQKEDTIEIAIIKETETEPFDTTINGIRLYAGVGSVAKEVTLTLNAIKQEESTNHYKFDFEVEDMELSENNNGGASIHLIVNNGPYKSYLDTEFSAELLEGNNVILAILSNDRGESVKSANGFLLRNMPIGEGLMEFDMHSPHLFYHSPMGEYTLGKEEKIVVDFYLVNDSLSHKGHQVELTIDGTKFNLPFWQSYWVEGLDIGNHNFRIRLVDQEGKLIPGPFNDSGIRRVTIKN